ncbi:TatD family hydrolase [Thermoproteota archaeon]
MIDSHAHLYLCKKPVDVLLERAWQAGVKAVMDVGINLETSLKAYETAKRYPNVVASIGIHPSEKLKIDEIDEMEQVLKTHSFSAIGEIGLDYFHERIPRELQKQRFEKQLKLAQTYKLPVIIHNRCAEDDMLPIVKQYFDLPMIFHCYSSDIAFAKEVSAPNHYFSFSGTITYSNKGQVLEVLKWVDLDHILIETDAPYLTPAVFKGQENEPAFVVETAKKAAEVKGIDLTELGDRLLMNMNRIFFIHTKPI